MVRLLPRSPKFFAYFRDAAANANAVASGLADLLLDYRDVEQKVRRLEDLEHLGDEITHHVLDALNTTFLTPLDREDIRDLAARLDDFVDFITAAAGRLALYHIEQPTERAQLLGRIIRDQGAAIDQAVALLETESKRQSILTYTVEINRLEDEADEVYSQALAALYDGADDIGTMVKAIHWGELYRRLEDATDRGEDLANSLEGIVEK
ncbi:MAG TPA: DUF47 family protein [Thermomicrobiaceae bacterium]|nr:DUF47 family protein [Thermomicrobiaceae bacterium]